MLFIRYHRATITSISEFGAHLRGFQGPIADALIEKVRQTGGILSHEDLNNFDIHVKRALEGSYRGRNIYTTSAPGAGPRMFPYSNFVFYLKLNKAYW